MKVVTTGSTGLIGSAVLSHLLSLEGVTSVVALSRRKLEVSHPKLEVVIVEDFGRPAADPSVRARLAGAGACVWALGTPRDGAEVHRDLTMAGVEALREVWEEGAGAKGPFRFVYTSGALAVRDQDAWVLLAGGMRKLRGQVENELLEYERTHGGEWESYVMRPAMVVNEEPVVGLRSLGMHILKSQLAAAAGSLATRGDRERIWDNAELARLGRRTLGGQK